MPVPESSLATTLLRLHNKLALQASEILQPLLDQLRELRRLRRKIMAADGNEQIQATEAMLDYLENDQ